MSGQQGMNIPQQSQQINLPMGGPPVSAGQGYAFNQSQFGGGMAARFGQAPAYQSPLGPSLGIHSSIQRQLEAQNQKQQMAAYQTQQAASNYSQPLPGFSYSGD